MVNHKEILRQKSLGPAHREIAESASCGRNTVTRTLAGAREKGLSWQQVQSMSPQEVTERLFRSILVHLNCVGIKVICYTKNLQALCRNLSIFAMASVPTFEAQPKRLSKTLSDDSRCAFSSILNLFL